MRQQRIASTARATVAVGAAPALPIRTSRLEPHVFRIAVVIVLGAIMSILDTTVINVALHDLATDFDAPLDTIQWASPATCSRSPRRCR